jgi:hypothetical protein
MGTSGRPGPYNWPMTKPFGNYIEVEGPKRWIDQTARQLAYQRKDYITVGYPTFYSLRGKESRRPPSKLLPWGSLRPDVLGLALAL